MGSKCRGYLKRSLVFFLCFKLGHSASAQVTTGMDSLFNALSEKRMFSGTILLARQGQVIYEKSFGYADHLQKKPFTPLTQFQVASLSKQFTAFAIMLLEYRRKLAFDDAVTKYLPR